MERKNQVWFSFYIHPHGHWHSAAFSRLLIPQLHIHSILVLQKIIANCVILPRRGPETMPLAGRGSDLSVRERENNRKSDTRTGGYELLSPRSNSNFTNSWFLRPDAIWYAVLPSLSFLSTAAPRFSSTRATSSAP